MVVIKAMETAPKYISLAEIKANSKLSDLALIKQSRLSVVPVSKEHWDIICEMAGINISKY